MEEKWLPTPITQISTSIILECKDSLKKNIAYNFQYLEYLINIEKNENVNKNYSTSVIMKMRYKSFVVVAMSIIESVFISLLEGKKLIPYDVKKSNRNEIKLNDTETCVIYIKKTSNKFKRLNFDDILDLMKEHQLLDIKETDYVILSKLKKLRNKVHIEKATCFIESDYNSFNYEVYNYAKILLYNVLKCSNVTDKKYNLYLENLKID